MSVLEIYINWVNSVLGEAGSYVEGVEAVQDGKVLCELIDVLAPDAGLMAKVKATGECTPLAYINTALDHMRSNGIKVKFPPEDIVHNEIKSMLDILWMLILNYGIHNIGQNAFQRSVGNGKKNLLEWCQEELEADFDHRNTLSFNLCSGNWFLKLLEKVAGCSMKKAEDKAEYIDTLLLEIQDRYLIMKDIIKANDIVDGTVDEHTLMIYLSLLKRRISNSGRHARPMLSTEGKAAAMAKIHFFEKRARSLSNESQRSKSVDSAGESPEKRHRSPSNGRSSSTGSDLRALKSRSKGLYDQVTGDGNETSDWSSTGSLHKLSPKQESSTQEAPPGQDVLYSTISERVSEYLPQSSSDAEKEVVSQRISEKETDTVSDGSKSLLRRGRASPQGRDPPVKHQPSRMKSLSPKTVVDRPKRNSPPNVVSVQTTSSVTQVSSGRSSSPSVVVESSNGVERKEVISPSSQRPAPVTTAPSYQSTLEMERGTRSLTSPSIDRPSSTVTERSPRQLGSRLPVHENVEPREESLRIRIKRPKDYIRQWEDTMDRLSNSSVTDSSPREPLIRSYANGSRSKSFEATSSSGVRKPPYSPRSRSNELTYSVTPNRSHSPVSQPAISSSHRPAISSDHSLQAIMDRLPPDMRHQAQEASKFLMHTSGPEVMTLINAIKQAREGDSRQAEREQTSIKRRELIEPSPSGTRVRFQTTPTLGRSQSEYTRPISNGAVSPRGLSSSPPRRRALTPTGALVDGEKGSDRMLSISPRDRSRSLSPRTTGDNLGTRSPRPQEMPSVDSSSRPLREELLLKNLGINSRVVEDERPSSRLFALSSSPRVSGSSESPRRILTSSPRRPTTAYPEVTRLELGLDSDRSYASQTEDLEEDAPPMLRRGGAGRVPRREAWEQQRRRKVEVVPQPITTSDSVGQSKFIEVLCKEIEVLKQKVEMMEDEEGRRSRSRSGRSPRSISNSRLSSSIRDENNEMVFAPRASSSSIGRDRSISCPLLQTSSRSTMLKASPRRVTGSDSSPYIARPVPTYPGRSLSNPGLTRTTSPRAHGVIPLGYSSPARSVTPEIWGVDLDNAPGTSIEKQEKWKQLISLRNLSEAEVIELKQALACAIVENDILQAKLNNARHEIHDKLRHTNEVLEDCRRHLAKSQAENMELRTKYEQEKQRGDNFETRIKELQDNVSKARVDNRQLEAELGKASSELDRSMQEKPGVESLKRENARLISRLAQAETENDSLNEQVHSLKHSQSKAMNTIDDLRECLHKVRRERQELYDEVETLRQREQSSRVREIINSYQEKGAKDEREQERRNSARSLHDSLNLSDEGNPFRPFRGVNDGSFRPSRKTTPRRSSSQHSYLSQDDFSPTRSREIYPHRTSYQPRSRSCSPRRSTPRLFDSSNLNDSFIDQTLQDIEHDMILERQNYLRKNIPSARRRLTLSSYASEENLASKKYQSTSPRYFGPGTSRSPSRGGYETDGGYTYSTSSIRNQRSRSRSPAFKVIDDGIRKRSASSSPCRFSPQPSILKSLDRRRDRSPSYTRTTARSTVANRSLTSYQATSGTSTPDRSPSPVYFPRESHSPPTRLSPDDKEKSDKSSSITGRRPLHVKSGPGQIARNLQREFDKEDKLLNALSKSTVFQNKSWFEMQSDSDDGDTGINSSMSSRSSFEKSTPTVRKKTPLLTEEQKRYADELIQKYTGNAPI